MITLLASLILIFIFAFLSGIHIYWAFGGRKWSDGVFPTMDNATKIAMPGIVPTLIVALGLLFFGWIVLAQTFKIEIPIFDASFYRYGLWFIFGIFFIRAVGEFKYLGLFKKIKDTTFGTKDTKIYTPLCLFISFLTLLLMIKI